MNTDEETLELIDNFIKAYEGESEETVVCLEAARDAIVRLKKEQADASWDRYENVDRQGGSFSQSEIDEVRNNRW